MELCIPISSKIAKKKYVKDDLGAKSSDVTGMCQRGRQGGGRMPPQILAVQKVPPGSGGAPHYYSPPQIFRLWYMPVIINQMSLEFFNNDFPA